MARSAGPKPAASDPSEVSKPRGGALAQGAARALEPQGRAPNYGGLTGAVRRGLPSDVSKLPEPQYKAFLAKAPRPIRDAVAIHLANGDSVSARVTIEGWAKFQNARPPAPPQVPGIQSATGVKLYAKFDPTKPDMVAAAAKAAKRPIWARLLWEGESHDNLRDLAKEWVRNRQARNLSEKPFEMDTPALGGHVLFTAESIGKIGGKTDVGLRMVPLIPDLLKNAEFVRWETAKRNQVNMTVAWLVSRLETDHRAHNVYIVVRRGPNGDFYYDHAYTQEGPTGLNYGIAP